MGTWNWNLFHSRGINKPRMHTRKKCFKLIFPKRTMRRVTCTSEMTEREVTNVHDRVGTLIKCTRLFVIFLFHRGTPLFFTLGAQQKSLTQTVLKSCLKEKKYVSFYGCEVVPLVANFSWNATLKLYQGSTQLPLSMFTATVQYTEYSVSISAPASIWKTLSQGPLVLAADRLLSSYRQTERRGGGNTGTRH